MYAPSRRHFVDLDHFLYEAVQAQIAAAHPLEDSKAPHTSLDVFEDSENNLIIAEFELPGLSKDEVKIEVHNGNLTVSGGVTESSERQERQYLTRERRLGKFSRTVKLPRGTNPEEVKASMENGLLTVTFPKSSPGMEPQRITID